MSWGCSNPCFSTNERMTVLFCKITNQMITKCKQHVMSHGRLWDQPVEPLLKNLHAALRLNEAYQEQYHITKDKLATQPKVQRARAWGAGSRSWGLGRRSLLA